VLLLTFQVRLSVVDFGGLVSLLKNKIELGRVIISRRSETRIELERRYILMCYNDIVMKGNVFINDVEF